MTKPDHDRVLAIMAKAPREGHVKTRLQSVLPPEVVVHLYRVLIEDSVALARAVGARIAAVCPTDDAAEMLAWLPPDVRVVAQHGRGLAAGLTSVFELLCEPTGSPVIAFNGDSPHLSPSVLESAFDALAHHDVVVGPCDDGGYYLVGARRSHRGLFDSRTMGGNSARDALIERARHLGLSAALTAEHYDVDLPEDLVRLSRELATQPERAPKTAALLAKWVVPHDRAAR